MSSHQPPAHLRYLKARLRPLLRPQVWGTIIFLLVVSTLAGVYFANLEEFTADENKDTPTLSQGKDAENEQAPQSIISPEDRAIAADIDTSTVLENDLAANSETLDATPDKPKENLFDQYMKQKQTQGKAANSSEGQANQQPAAVNVDYNPFTVKFTQNNPGRNEAVTSTNPFLYNPSNNYSNGLNSTNNTTTNLNNTNALQTALDRANGYNRQTSLDANGNAINPLQAALDRQSIGQSNINLIAQPNQVTPLLGTTPYYTGVTTTIPNSGVPVQGTVPLNSYSNVSGNTVPTVQVPTTGVSANPGLTNNPPNSYTYLNQPQVPTTTQTVPSTSSINNSNVLNSAVQTAPNQVQNTPAPFSVPNNIPGRTIGGGQINTFSNP